MYKNKIYVSLAAAKLIALIKRDTFQLIAQVGAKAIYQN